MIFRAVGAAVVFLSLSIGIFAGETPENNYITEFDIWKDASGTYLTVKVAGQNYNFKVDGSKKMEYILAMFTHKPAYESSIGWKAVVEYTDGTNNGTGIRFYENNW